MEYECFPDNPNRFNVQGDSDKSFIDLHFWSELYNSSPWGYAKLKDLIRVIYEVNGYFVIASFKEASKKSVQKKINNDPNHLTHLLINEIDHLNIGELDSIFATDDLATVVNGLAPKYFKKCVQAELL